MTNNIINEKENKVIICLDPNIYPLDSIYGAAYVFLDRAYIFLDGDPKKEVRVQLKGKKSLNKSELNELAGEFSNELLNYSLRFRISKNNQKIREYIVGAALIGASGELEEELEESEVKVWQKDPLGIAVPWEEKYGKDKKKNISPKSKNNKRSQ